MIYYLQDQLRDNSVIYCQWYDDSIVQLMLSNGLLVQIQVCPFTGDIQEIHLDKYLIGKLSEHVSDGNVLFYVIYYFFICQDLYE